VYSQDGNYLVEFTFSSESACLEGDVLGFQHVNIAQLGACLAKPGFSGADKYFKFTCAENPVAFGLSILDCGSDDTCSSCFYDDGIDYEGGCVQAGSGSNPGGTSYYCGNVTGGIDTILSEVNTLPLFQMRAYSTSDCSGEPGFMRAVRADNFCDGGYNVISYDDQEITGCLTEGCQNCQAGTQFGSLGFDGFGSQETRFDITLSETIDLCYFDLTNYVSAFFYYDPPVFTSTSTSTSTSAETSSTSIEETSAGTSGGDTTEGTSGDATGTEVDESDGGFGSIVTVSFVVMIANLLI
jgi:hypothetical protein